MFTYTPTAAARIAASAPNASTAVRTDTFTVTVDDGHGGTALVSVKLTIAAIDGDFTAGTPNATTGAITGKVTARDPDGNPLSYSGSFNTGKGAVTVQSSGTYTYTPTAAARHGASAVGAQPDVTTDSFVVTVARPRRQPARDGQLDHLAQEQCAVRQIHCRKTKYRHRPGHRHRHLDRPGR